jgi:hypothetical protein
MRPSGVARGGVPALFVVVYVMALFTGPGPGRPKGSTNKRCTEARDAARAIVDDPVYRAALKLRVLLGEATHMEPLLWYYAHGKPTERIEVRDTTNEFDGLSAEQLRREAMEIARTIIAEPVVLEIEAHEVHDVPSVKEDGAVH